MILDMPEKEYRALDRLSKSDLVYFAESPLHFRERKNLFKKSEDMELGTLAHTAILEPAKLRDSYIVEPETITLDGKTVDVNKRVKGHREWMASWREEQEGAGRIIITPKNLDRLTGMVERAKEHRGLEHLLNMPGQAEVCCLFDYKGRPLKGRADKLIEHEHLGRTVFELKTTQSSKPSNFSRDILNRFYDIGIACYLHGFEAKEFIFGAIQSTPPYPISIFRVPEAVIERSFRHFDKVLYELARCENEDYWPAYTRDMEELHLPAWVPALDAESGFGDLILE